MLFVSFLLTYSLSQFGDERKLEVGELLSIFSVLREIFKSILVNATGNYEECDGHNILAQKSEIWQKYFVCMKLAQSDKLDWNVFLVFFLGRGLCKRDSFFTVCRGIHSDTTSLSLE